MIEDEEKYKKLFFEILSSDQSLSYFEQFLQAEYATENLYFWKETNKFNDILFSEFSSSSETLSKVSSESLQSSFESVMKNDFHHTEEVRRMLLFIYENFISAGGPEEINISILVKKRIHNWFVENVPKKEFLDSDNVKELGKEDVKNLTGDIFSLVSKDDKLTPQSINFAHYDFLYLEIPKTLFDECREHVLNVLRADSFRRFIQSPLFREMAKNTLSREWLKSLESELEKLETPEPTVRHPRRLRVPSDNPPPINRGPPLLSETRRKSFRISTKTFSSLGVERNKKQVNTPETHTQVHEFLSWWGCPSMDYKIKCISDPFSYQRIPKHIPSPFLAFVDSKRDMSRITLLDLPRSTDGSIGPSTSLDVAFSKILECPFPLLCFRAFMKKKKQHHKVSFLAVCQRLKSVPETSETKKQILDLIHEIQSSYISKLKLESSVKGEILKKKLIRTKFDDLFNQIATQLLPSIESFIASSIFYQQPLNLLSMVVIISQYLRSTFEEVTKNLADLNLVHMSIIPLLQSFSCLSPTFFFQLNGLQRYYHEINPDGASKPREISLSQNNIHSSSSSEEGLRSSGHILRNQNLNGHVLSQSETCVDSNSSLNTNSSPNISSHTISSSINSKYKFCLLFTLNHLLKETLPQIIQMILNQINNELFYSFWTQLLTQSCLAIGHSIEPTLTEPLPALVECFKKSDFHLPFQREPFLWSCSMSQSKSSKPQKYFLTQTSLLTHSQFPSPLGSLAPSISTPNPPLASISSSPNELPTLLPTSRSHSNDSLEVFAIIQNITKCTIELKKKGGNLILENKTTKSKLISRDPKDLCLLYLSMNSLIPSIIDETNVNKITQLFSSLPNTPSSISSYSIKK